MPCVPQDQNKKLEKAEGNYHRINARLREQQASTQEGSAAKIFERLQEDVKGLRFQVCWGTQEPGFEWLWLHSSIGL